MRRDTVCGRLGVLFLSQELHYPLPHSQTVAKPIMDNLKKGKISMSFVEIEPFEPLHIEKTRECFNSLPEEEENKFIEEVNTLLKSSFQNNSHSNMSILDSIHSKRKEIVSLNSNNQASALGVFIEIIWEIFSHSFKKGITPEQPTQCKH